MDDNILNIIIALGSIGTCVSVIISLIQITKTVRFKSEKIYGKEAKRRYEDILKTINKKTAQPFGPDEYEGGNKITPQLEIERFYFDKHTMPSAWKKCKKTISYYYKENEKRMVCGWRL
jgi:hypothetical protein